MQRFGADELTFNPSVLGSSVADVPLVAIDSPYRSVVAPFLSYTDEQLRRVDLRRRFAVAQTQSSQT